MLISSQRVDNDKHGLRYEFDNNVNSVKKTMFVKAKEIVNQQLFVLERKPMK